MSSYKIAVIGDRESVIGFRAVGLDVFPTDESGLKRVFASLTKTPAENPDAPRYAIIYITEEYAVLLHSEIEALKDELIPAVIPIPSKNGAVGIGMASLNSTVERAVGANIL